MSRFRIAILVIIVFDVTPILMMTRGGAFSETLLLQALLAFCIVSIIALFWLCRNLTKKPVGNALIGLLLACIQGFVAFLCIVGLSFHHYP